MPNPSISDIRTEYKKAALSENEVATDPFDQFHQWLDEVLHSEVMEPNAMTLATAGKDGRPSARIVLLKGVDERGFYFYTNYESRKGQQLHQNPHAALVFFWKELERQVRIEGKVFKATAAQSDAYFLSRPEGSQLGAWTSPQSRIISSRAILEERMTAVRERFDKEHLTRPDFWGGYCLAPERVEFWQGRPNRLHDRILFTPNTSGGWEINRLAP